MHWSNPLYDICIAEAVRRLDSDIVGESADEETAMKAELEFVGASGIIHSSSKIIHSSSRIIGSIAEEAGRSFGGPLDGNYTCESTPRPPGGGTSRFNAASLGADGIILPSSLEITGSIVGGSELVSDGRSFGGSCTSNGNFSSIAWDYRYLSFECRRWWVHCSKCLDGSKYHG